MATLSPLVMMILWSHRLHSEDASCSATPRFSDVMAAHLAQGHSIAYYGPDNVFVGDVSWPYPANAGIIYLCASGSVGGAYQSFCTVPTGDNLFISGGPRCIVSLPMSHVDDGCYDPSLAVVNGTSTDNGITRGPSATAHCPATTVTVTAQSLSHRTSSPGVIVIVAILVFGFCVPLM
ncbi:hypothetical protein BD410DRAFT_653558 [Rickenella mellea]|uniref:Uncharacterized protein n=1 Tax=Rickenella mellea TaxID=50990 RepID=A0A4Y7PME8_9AGAM|nr:hypothetical protein BD410DRAFT_653558 [Rickenella mellea]